MSIRVGLRELEVYIRVLHCPTRWYIIETLSEGAKSTSEIFEELKRRSKDVSKPSLYYHLSELDDADIIEIAEYRETGGGAPEKVWKLKAKQIVIELTRARIQEKQEV